MIVSSIVAKKLEFERGKNTGMHPAEIYLQGVQKKIDAFEEALAFLRQIKRGEPSMSDEIVLKMYGPK